MLYSVCAPGPKTIVAPVFSAKSTWPETKSAWKCVSKTYLILALLDFALSIYCWVSLNGSMMATSPLDSI